MTAAFARTFGRTGAPARAMLVLAALLLVFLWAPLTRGGYYAGVDILQHFSIFHVSPERYDPKNSLVGDTVLVMFPGIAWSVEELRNGRLPLWNPHNGWGVPHLAGFQAGVFSPYSAPFHVLSFRHALVASAFLKLFGFGALTWLFLRRIGCGAQPALLGAVAFTFSGYNVLWLHYPLSGAVLVVPAGMYLAEAALQTGSPARRGVVLAAFTFSLAAGLMAGHPETFFFGSLLVGAWIAFRLASVEAAGRRLLEFALCGVVALGLCAVQLLPFFEYVRESTIFAERTGHGFFGPIAAHTLPLHFFPNLLGHPNRVYTEMAEFAGVNYIEANTAHVGFTTLCAAGWTLVTLRRHRSREAAFFAAVAAAWAVYAYDVAGLGRLISRLPLFSLTVPHRSQVVWGFTVSCLAAIGAEQAVRGRAAGRPAEVARWGIALLAVAVGSALAVYGRIRLDPPPGMVPMRLVGLHMAVVLALTLAGLAALARLASDRGASRWPLPLLVASVFLQTGFLWRAFNPTIEDRYFYPRTPALERLARDGGAQTLYADAAWVPANVNLWYRLRSVWHYDGMGVRRADWLKRRLLGGGRSDLGGVTVRALQVLGIRRVVTGGAPPFDGRLEGLAHEWTDGRIQVYTVRGARPRFFTVGAALAAADDEEAVRLLAAPGFDPARAVVLHGPAPAAAGGNGGAVEVVSETPAEIRLRVSRTGPGWLVALVTPLPGWTAAVDGRPAALARADVAFTAVAVGGGTHDVVLRYAPRSVRVGAAISLATLAAAVLAALGLAASLRARTGRPPAVP